MSLSFRNFSTVQDETVFEKLNAKQRAQKSAINFPSRSIWANEGDGM